MAKSVSCGSLKTIIQISFKEHAPSAEDIRAGFHRIDFDRSVVGLRLDATEPADYIEFAFRPWPHGYVPDPSSIEVTSVHVHFVGTRPRVGFRFSVSHIKCRIPVAQEQIDELRSRKFPRQSNDQEFLGAVREHINKGYCRETGESAEQTLRVVSVDLGTSRAAAALFVGRRVDQCDLVPITKLEKLYTDVTKNTNNKVGTNSDSRGLVPKHVQRHLDQRADSITKLIEERRTRRRLSKELTLVTDPADLRRFTLHIRWMLRDWVRLNASQIMKFAIHHSADLIVFESLRGFTLRPRDAKESENNERLARFAFGRIRGKVTEKAVERGMRVVTVPYAYSSQFCGLCGERVADRKKWEQNKRKSQFVCEACTHTCDSDKNAAIVLGKVFWGDLTLPNPDEIMNPGS